MKMTVRLADKGLIRVFARGFLFAWTREHRQHFLLPHLHTQTAT